MKNKWTKESAFEASRQCNTRFEFQRKCKGAYNFVWTQGLLDECCAHMKVLRKQWTADELHAEALKYSNRKAFEVGSNAAYQFADNHGLLDTICSHMKLLHYSWNDEELAKEALKYNFRKDFESGSPAYQVARRRGILDSICSHMVEQCHKWSDEELAQEALKYTRRLEFSIHSNSAYTVARTRGILDQICSHMKRIGGYTTGPEREILTLIQQQYPSARKKGFGHKTHGTPGNYFELDIYVPEICKGVEFDGTYWHSIQGLSKNRKKWPVEMIECYHELKDEFFRQRNIAVLHIKECDWTSNRQNALTQIWSFLRG